MKKRTFVFMLGAALMLPLTACGDFRAGNQAFIEPSPSVENTSEPPP